MPDFIYQGSGSGNVANTLLANDFNPHALRPYIGKDNQSYLNVNAAEPGGAMRSMVTNTPASLRRDDWKIIDTAVVKAAQPRMKLIGDWRSQGMVYTVPNGMGKTVLETSSVSDINPATISMDGLRQGADDRPHFDLYNLPLPIIHKDFSYHARQIQASRNGGSPLDTTHAELAARKVAEEAEKLALGVSDFSQYSFGGGTIYGLTDYTSRLTATVTSPAAPGWTPKTTFDEVQAMVQQSIDNYHYGPWKLYTGPSWSTALNDDYSSAKGDNSLRDRILRIENLQDVQTLDFLSGYNMVLVQQTSDVARVVVGMDIVTVQWESNGGMMLNFKVMAIMVPQLRADFNSRTGIVHGNV